MFKKIIWPMQNILLFLLSLLLLLLVGCGGENGSNSDNPLLGNWEVVSTFDDDTIRYLIEAMDEGEIIEFRSDGQVIFMSIISGYQVLEGNRLKVEGALGDIVYAFEIKEDELTLHVLDELDPDSEMIFRRLSDAEATAALNTATPTLSPTPKPTVTPNVTIHDLRGSWVQGQFVFDALYLYFSHNLFTEENTSFRFVDDARLEDAGKYELNTTGDGTEITFHTDITSDFCAGQTGRYEIVTGGEDKIYFRRIEEQCADRAAHITTNPFVRIPDDTDTTTSRNATPISTSEIASESTPSAPESAPASNSPTPTPASPSIPSTSTPTPDHPFARYLPQTWEGSWENYEMVLYVEEVSENSFQGKINWPSIHNSVTSMHGEFVKDFGDFIEQTKWAYVEGFDSDKSGSWLKFTELELLQGSNIILNGWYYAHIENDGRTMKGVWFPSKNASTPSGAFTITLIQ